MAKTGAAKLKTNSEVFWCHFSQNGESIKLRRIVDGEILELDSEDFEIEESLTLASCKKLFPNQRTYSIDAIDVWSQILALLNDGTASSIDQGNFDFRHKLKVVPRTRLRKYYDSMIVLERAVLNAIADLYARKSVLFENLWNHSHKQFLTYNNPEKWQQSRRKPLPEFKGPLSEVSNTNEFTSFFQKRGIAGSGYKFVDREIAPWNTKQGIFTNGLPATKTGKGGMDLLLQNEDGLPVVGEIKVGEDKNCFFALLQATMYAAELSTPNQLKRLQRTYSNVFTNLDQNSAIEVAIILVNPVRDETLGPTKKLISDLNLKKHCRGLSKIKLYMNSGEHWSSYQ